MYKESNATGASISQSKIDAKHHYRFKYLKSEHWSNLRIAKLASVDAVCRNCKLRDLSNDVHHLNYRNLYDVTLNDLVVLCRKCHDLAHEALEIHRGFIKKAKNPWLATKQLMTMITLSEKFGLSKDELKKIESEKFMNIFWKKVKRLIRASKGIPEDTPNPRYHGRSEEWIRQRLKWLENRKLQRQRAKEREIPKGIVLVKSFYPGKKVVVNISD